ncbi:NusG domain II-containing protein [Paenibacillus sp. IHBB 10380]|uniref:NusG domain II-containing protein n=1 Tax=Paenibacillus sp. IHBB 10380 TaxID=1566358 RepID=UPI0005CFD671|nr:NusG domain II-containing protein [Paenibacillus sp. IHBB 10380]AJS61045.1 hypothetical protein UB51_24300 [Paenibacillus sp. IHBB 10380]
MKRGDLLIITIVVAVALFFLVPRWLPENDSEKSHIPLTADITVDGEFYKTVTLTKEEQNYDIKTARGHNILKVHDYGVEMYDADCPDQVCLSFGFITKSKQSIICLPHRVMVEINGIQDVGDEPDAVVQ